jgi:hypothetical protein
LVLPIGTEVVIRAIRLSSGRTRYAVDQLSNPLSITFTPGGLWSSGMMLYGRVTTASSVKEAKSLLGRFERPLKKAFTKIRAFYVGPEASALLAQGMRLTLAAQTPARFDLKPA